MKSKRRHHSTSDESEESEVSAKTNSSSESESDVSSEQRYKKKRKRAASSVSVSDSDSEVQKRPRKRKHKKKKKKHGKKKRHTVSGDESASEHEVISESEGEISSKKKRKHKHKRKHSKRARSSSLSEVAEVPVQRRLHSVVKERHQSIECPSQPTRTYYHQKTYQDPGSADEYEREREQEVQRFYRGSSKERRNQYQEKYQERYQYERDQRTYRQARYEERRSPQEDYRKPREENYSYSKEDPRGYNRQESGPKRREFEYNREYRDRRAAVEYDRYREREYTDNRERYREEYHERSREIRRERPTRPEKIAVPLQKEPIVTKSKSPEVRYRERDRRPDDRGERNDRYRNGRAPEKRERPERADEDKSTHRRPPADIDSKPRERKSRFADINQSKEYSWGKTEVKKEVTQVDKEKPNFGLSGKLTADANTVNGVVIKYTEPDDAKQPKRRWRFYPFKGDKALPILYIHRQSSFLMGRDKKVVDIILEHPSVSKQHAALQYRATPFTRPDGTQGRRVRPYIIDLDSANGTFVNNKKIEPRRYVELLERDVVKFGFSQREYVLLHENSKDEAQDDDHHDPPEIGAAVTTTEQIKQDKRVKQEIAEDGD